MDKYLMIVLIFMIGGMGIAITREPPVLGLFYAMLAGALVVIIYSSIQARKKMQEERRRRRKSGK